MSPTAYETIVYETHGHTALIVFNRPDRLNAISHQMAVELRDAFARAEGDDDIWTLVVTANGRAFCSGAEVGTVRRIAGRAEIEVSGGIRADTVVAYAKAGPDSISIGGLTHSARSADVSMEISLVA